MPHAQANFEVVQQRLESLGINVYYSFCAAWADQDKQVGLMEGAVCNVLG